MIDKTTDEIVETNNSQFRQYPYRFLIVALFGSISFLNGVCWVVVTPISTSIELAYQQTSLMVSIIPMCYMVCYVFINFPSNWILDDKGIKKGIICGAVFTTLGSAIRCLVQFHFLFLLFGQILCAFGQPFILNAPTKIANRWFATKNRSLALAVLAVMNIIGTAAGFVLPSIFVSQSDSIKTIKQQFLILLILQFSLVFISTLLILYFFKQQPPTLPSLGSMVKNMKFKQSFKYLIKQPIFIALALAFGSINGSFNTYGSLLNYIMIPYSFTNNQISLMAASMLISGIISATLISIYIEKTLKYTLVFKILAFIGAATTVSFSVLLHYDAQFWLLILTITLQGMVFIPMLPISFDYASDVLFLVGQAQITGSFLTTGQIIGIICVLISNFSLGLGDSSSSQQWAALVTTIMCGSIAIFGLIIYSIVDAPLKRTQLQQSNQKTNSLLSTFK